MKHLYLNCLLLGLFSLWGIKAVAYDCEVNGIYYNLDTTAKTARVTYLSYGSYDNQRAYSGSVTIPSSFTYGTTYSVTSIGDYAFYGCSGLTSIEIPNSVTNIGNSAFYYCIGLTSITIPNSVTSIGESAFSGCSGLTSIEIPNSVTRIGSSAFSNCIGLTKVIVKDIAAWCNIKFSDSVSNPLSYVHHLFSDENTEITELIIPEGVTSIGGFAFSGCSGLTSLTIPNSVTSIGEYAFYYCIGLTSITFPNSVTSIGDRAFYECIGLTSVTIPNSVTSIGRSAFYGCSGLTSLTIPNSVTIIGNSAFSGCSGLTSLTIPNSVTIIGDYAFYGCSGLTSLTIPNSVTSIGWSVFSGCSGLTSLTIPNSVTSIGHNAFRDCSGLTSITIPNSVTSIGNNAFEGCKLENVLAKNPTTKSEYAFSDRTYQHAMCYVPEGTWGIAVYDGDWYRFNNIRELAMGKDALSSQKVYTMMETQSFSYVIYDGASNEAKMVKAFYNLDEEDPNNNWQIIEHAGNTYLYNIGAKQYACLTEDGKIALTAIATPIELYDGENGVVLGSNSSSQWGFVVNKAFGTGGTSIVLPTDGSNQNAVYYGLDGQQLSSPRKGLNIVKNKNGKTKRIFVK